jgi:hypothetical protein
MHTKPISNSNEFGRNSGRCFMAAGNGRGRVQGACPIFRLLSITTVQLYSKGSDSNEARGSQDATQDFTKMHNLPKNNTHGLPLAVSPMQTLVL